MPGLSHKTILLATVAAVSLISNQAVLASKKLPQRSGKVVIIRGAFTVFSLGLNELGHKLRKHGLDVEVVPDIMSGRAAQKLRKEYLRNPKAGPIVFIGHSRGGELGPKQARYLQKYNIPVRLIVIVDAVHETSIPANVERCVNFYHTNSLGILHGLPATAEGNRTDLVNADIGKLRIRKKPSGINHFNIDASGWIHELIISQVLDACASREQLGPTIHAELSDKSKAKQTAPSKKKKSTRQNVSLRG